MLKQVIVMRTDLNMRKGKMIAQGAHASMLFLLETLRVPNADNFLNFTRWVVDDQMTKICVRVDSEGELLKIEDQARDAGLRVHVVTDAGHTEFHGVPTRTCLAIGPDDAEEIDKITGMLRLL